MKKNMKYQRGQAIILIVFGIVGLIGMTALAVDGGNTYSDRRHAQNAADTAAFAAALDKLNGGTIDTLQAAGWARALSNGYEKNTAASTVVVNDPPQNSQYDCTHIPATCNEYVQVIITSNVKTFFAPIVGIPQVTNTVQAVAHAKPGNPTLPLYGGNTIVGLAPSSCDAVSFCGSSTMLVKGGGVYSNSSSNCGLEFSGGHATNVNVNDGAFQTVASGYTVNGTPSITSSGGFQDNQTPYPYPPTDLPNPTCSANGTVSGSTLSPGNFGSASNPLTFPPSGVTTLNAGTYCVYGDFNLTGGTFTGNGVTIVMETGAIHWNGNSNVTLSPPTSGANQGLTLFAPLSNTSVMVINGSADVTLTGTLLMPAASLSYNGNANINKSTTSNDLQFIAKKVELCGNNNTTLAYGSSNTAKQSSPPTLELSQ